MDKLHDNVCVRKEVDSKYPDFPYYPNKIYPELKNVLSCCDKANNVYEMVRDILFDLGLDKEHFGLKEWNPFKFYVKKGQCVVIKPNWVFHRNNSGYDLKSMVTNSSIIRPLIDYSVLSMKGEGSIVIVDAPIQSCDWKLLASETKIISLIDHLKKVYPKINFQLLDLRKTVMKGKQKHVEGDPGGYYLIDLGKDSILSEINEKCLRFRVPMYDHKLMQKHHNKRKHEYLVSKTVMDADFIMNIPKLKCHKKAGLTSAMKNVVGINGHKEYLPHYIKGCKSSGGDQYERFSVIKSLYNYFYDKYWTFGGNINKIIYSFLIFIDSKLGGDNVVDGSWIGNVTIPRTVVDLNNILYFYDLKRKILSDIKQRNIFTVVDGIISGEGEGPLSPTPKPIGAIVGGFNPLTIDCVVAKLIGYKVNELNILNYAFSSLKSKFRVCSVNDIKLKYNGENMSMGDVKSLNFVKPKHWGRK